MASNFSVIPIRWLLTVDSEMAFFSFSNRSLRVWLFSFKTHAFQEKNIIAKLVKCKVNFTGKNRCRTHRFVIHAISVFSVKFTVEFNSLLPNRQ